MAMMQQSEYSYLTQSFMAEFSYLTLVSVLTIKTSTWGNTLKP